MPADTSPEMWRRQMAAIAERSVAERLEEWEALNRELAQMEAAGVRLGHPDYSDEVFLALVRRRHGDRLVRAAWPGRHLPDT